MALTIMTPEQVAEYEAMKALQETSPVDVKTEANMRAHLEMLSEQKNERETSPPETPEHAPNAENAATPLALAAPTAEAPANAPQDAPAAPVKEPSSDDAIRFAIARILSVIERHAARLDELEERERRRFGL